MDHSRLPIYALAEHYPSRFVAPDPKAAPGKVDRAKHHLADLRDRLEGDGAGSGHSVNVEHDEESLQYVFRVSNLPDFDPAWSYIAGDCIHNLRSALDHLVVQLAVLSQGGRRLTEDEVRRCAFPVHTDPKVFRNSGRNDIRLLRSGDKTRIEELQPFNAMDMSIWGPVADVMVPNRSQPAKIPGLLERLSRLDNVDKHRRVNAMWRGATWYEHDGPPDPFRQSSVTTAWLEEGAEIGRWGYAGVEPPPQLPAGLDLEAQFPIAVAIGDPGGTWGYGALHLLEWFVAAVETVVELFTPCFETAGPASPVVDLERIAFSNWMSTAMLAAATDTEEPKPREHL